VKAQSALGDAPHTHLEPELEPEPEPEPDSGLEPQEWLGEREGLELGWGEGLELGWGEGLEPR